MGKNVLIVDDSPTLRATVHFALSEAGFSIFQAENGRDGLKKLDEFHKKGQRVNLIISDINMPEMNGIEFLTRIKAGASFFRFIPVVVLTTEKEETLKQKGRQLGAAGWMTKPFKPDLLLSVVRKFIR
jgi:two-component system, chemotaxis family, chemotaxis protein CheY